MSSGIGTISPDKLLFIFGFCRECGKKLDKCLMGNDPSECGVERHHICIKCYGYDPLGGPDPCSTLVIQ